MYYAVYTFNCHFNLKYLISKRDIFLDLQTEPVCLEHVLVQLENDQYNIYLVNSFFGFTFYPQPSYKQMWYINVGVRVIRSMSHVHIHVKKWASKYVVLAWLGIPYCVRNTETKTMEEVESLIFDIEMVWDN